MVDQTAHHYPLGDDIISFVIVIIVGKPIGRRAILKTCLAKYMVRLARLGAFLFADDTGRRDSRILIAIDPV